MKKANYHRAKNAVEVAFQKLQECKSSTYLQEKYFKACKMLKRMERELAGNQLKISK